MISLVLATRLPRVELKEEERAGAWTTHLTPLKEPHVLLYTLGIFCCVGTEQGVANWIAVPRAVVPLVIGGLGDVFGLCRGMLFLYLPLGYILSIGFWARHERDH